MISGHYQGIYPSPNMMPASVYPDFAELMRKAKLYDEMMKQPDCPDPAKLAWKKKLEEYMREKYGLEPK